MIAPVDQQLDWFSPPQLGRMYHFAPETIIAAIHRNELKATNMAAKPGGRARWRVKLEDFEAYMLRRSNVATARPPRVRREKKTERVIEFY